MVNYTLHIDINSDEEDYVLSISIKNKNNKIINHITMYCVPCEDYIINYENIVFNKLNGKTVMSIIENQFTFLNYDAKTTINLSIVYDLTNEEINQFKSELIKLKTIKFQ